MIDIHSKVINNELYVYSDHITLGACFNDGSLAADGLHVSSLSYMGVGTAAHVHLHKCEFGSPRTHQSKSILLAPPTADEINSIRSSGPSIPQSTILHTPNNEGGSR